MRGRLLAHALPPDVAVVGQCDVGVDDVLFQRRHGVEVGLLAGTRRHAEIAGLRVDGVEAAIGARLDPGDVVAHRGDFPAIEAFRRDQHGEVGLAARRGKRRRDIGLLALRRFDAEDQHVFGQPAFVAGHGRGDAQREALLAQQGIAAVARTVGPDLARLGEMDDVLGGRVAGPLHVGLARLQRRTDRVQAGHERPIRADDVIDGLAHAGHGAHIDHHIGGVGDLDADVRDGRAERPHAERDDIHGPATHGALEQAGERFLHLGRRFPVVGRAGVLLPVGADVGAVLDAGNVGGIGAGEVGIWALGRIELDEGAGLDHLCAKAVVLVLRAVTPDNLIGSGQGGHFGHPGF